MQMPGAFDVIIVGAGTAGGTAAQLFCRAGFRVLLLEAGGATPATIEDKPNLALDAMQRVQARCYAFSANTRGYFVNDVDNPYSTASERPFSWIRARAVGGRSLLWAGHCYRMSDLDFKAPQRDGIGDSWPLTYDEIKPYYDQAERQLEVRDAALGPSGPGDADFEKGNEFTPVVKRLQAICAGKGLQLVPARVSDSRRPLESLKPCLHCGHTSQECVRPVTSAGSTLAEALGTGNLTVWTQVHVHTVVVNAHGEATGVAGIRAATGDRFEASARTIFLCASTLDSTRILLNSTSRHFPDGLGNSSRVLGHYLMDHVSGIVLTAVFDCQGTLPLENGRAAMFYIPRWQNLSGPDHDFRRGYGYQAFMIRSDHELLPCGRTQKKQQPSNPDRGGQLTVRLVAFGEMLPNYDSYVEIDKAGRRDAWGIPVLKIDCHHGENEKAMVRDMVSSGVEILQGAGGCVTEIQQTAWEPGLAIHEAGTCRMGEDPRTSVLNRLNQCHEVPNLFVTDAACFPSIGVQNPVLTIVALTIRACTYAMRQLSGG